MMDRLTAEIERVRSDKTISALDEANVKQGVILPVLNALGWNPFNTNEVRPEYPVSGGNVDYSLRLLGTNKVFLEAKRPREDLNTHQEQLLNYSFKHGVSLAALTNGLDWWFYLPLREGSWEERRFCTIDLRNRELSQVVTLLARFLSRSNVGSGEAIKHAKLHLAILQKGKKIEEALPKAWERLITGLDESLAKLLNEKVKEICGWEAGREQIERFLGTLPKRVSTTSIAIPSSISSQRPTSSPRHQRTDTVKKTSPLSFIFRGQKFEVKSWRRLLTTLAEDIYKRHPSEFGDKVRGLGGMYADGDTMPSITPAPIGDSGWSVYTNISGKSTEAKCHELLVVFGYSKEDLEIETA